MSDQFAPVPTNFHAYIGGYFGSSYSVDLEGSSLIHIEDIRENGLSRRTKVEPGLEDWLKFRQTLDALKISFWKKNYRSISIDGTQWALEIIYDDQIFISGGDNSYPDSRGRSRTDTTKTFKPKFCIRKI